jgi:hypothetical protein
MQEGLMCQCRHVDAILIISDMYCRKKVSFCLFEMCV